MREVLSDLYPTKEDAHSKSVLIVQQEMRPHHQEMLLYIIASRSTCKMTKFI
jgi:hypothetical protein